MGATWLLNFLSRHLFFPIFDLVNKLAGYLRVEWFLHLTHCPLGWVKGYLSLLHGDWSFRDRPSWGVENWGSLTSKVHCFTKVVFPLREVWRGNWIFFLNWCPRFIVFYSVSNRLNWLSWVFFHLIQIQLELYSVRKLCQICFSWLSVGQLDSRLLWRNSIFGLRIL